MKIINKTKGPIYYTTSFPASKTYPSGASDCGQIAMNNQIYIPYNDVEGETYITLLENNTSKPNGSNSQKFPIKGSDEILVQLTVK
jgi:hypothetical protein